jgi:hypothetical protein
MVTFHFCIIGNFADSGSSDKKQEPPAIKARAHSDPDFANWCSGGSADILRWESLLRQGFRCLRMTADAEASLSLLGGGFVFWGAMAAKQLGQVLGEC